MRKIPALILSVFLLGLLTACIDFGEQAAMYHYDLPTDTLRLFQEYRGIRSDKEVAGAEEREQLASVVKGQRTFFFNNWMTDYERARVEDSLASLRDPVKRAARKLDEGGLAKLEKFLKLLLENVRVENGPFYFDSSGHLCGVQYVTVTKCSEVLAAGNDYAPVFARSLAAESNSDPAEKAAWLKYAAKPQPMVTIEGNLVTARFPLTAADYDRQFRAAAEDPKSAERKAGLKLSFTNNLMTLQYGGKGDNVSRLTLTVNTNKYTTNLVELARAQHVVRDRFNAKKAAKEFLLGGAATDIVKP